MLPVSPLLPYRRAAAAVAAAAAATTAAPRLMALLLLPCRYRGPLVQTPVSPPCICSALHREMELLSEYCKLTPTATQLVFTRKRHKRALGFSCGTEKNRE